MAHQRQQDIRSRRTAPRRRASAAAAPAPVLTGVPAGARALSPGPEDRSLVEPVPTRPTEWADVGEAPGRHGDTHVSFARHTDHSTRETIAGRPVILPPGPGATTSVTFRPLGGGRAVLSGAPVVIAEEAGPVLVAPRSGGVELVETHRHNPTDELRLFFVHYRAVGDAVRLARAVRRAVDTTHVVPMPGGAG